MSTKTQLHSILFVCAVLFLISPSMAFNLHNRPRQRFYPARSTFNLASRGISTSPGTKKHNSFRLQPQYALAKSFEEQIYNPPPYLIDLIKENDNQRLTIPQVAVKGGVELGSAKRDLMAMATLTGATLEVTGDGEIMFTFPTNIESVLRKKSNAYKVQEVVDKVKPAVSYAYRVSFGVALLSSLAIISVALLAAASSSSSSSTSSSDDNKKRQSSSSSYSSSSIRFYIDPIDIMDLTVRTSFRGYNRKMSFLEAVFSFLFGDGDPNENFDSDLYKAAAELIISNSGLVTAEELAALIKQPAILDTKTGLILNEAEILPLLIRFNGSPVVTEEGNILYSFPELLELATNTNDKTDSSKPSSNKKAAINGMINSFFLSKMPSFNNSNNKQKEAVKLEDKIQETPVAFTQATPDQVAVSVILGGANIIGATWLQAYVRTLPIAVASLPFWITMRTISPFLFLYSLAYVATPMIRGIQERKTNKGIVERNTKRKAIFTALKNPSEYLQRKLQEKEKYKQEMLAERKRRLQEGLDEGRDVIVFDSSRSDALRRNDDD